MNFLGFSQIKKEVNQVQKHLGWKKSDTPAWIIYCSALALVPVGFIFGLIKLGREALTADSPPQESISRELHILFRKTQTVHSNIVPTTDEIIDLDHAGNLMPAPYNVPLMLSSSGSCTQQGDILPYPQGMVLVLNVAPLMSSHDFKNPNIPARAMAFNAPPLSNYFAFTPGVTKEITTGGRTFLVKLSRMEDLTTQKNGPYFSYTFDIDEKR